MSTCRILAGVEMGEGAEIGDFVVVGVLPRFPPGDAAPSTRLGPSAVLRSHTVIYAGSTIGARFQTGHGALVREFCRIGDDVSVGSHSVVEHRVEIAHRVRIHSNAFIPEFCVLEEEAWVGPGAVLTNARYPQSPGAKDRLAGVRLRRRAKVGAGAVLLPGIVVGAEALVGAGAVVLADVPDFAVVAGNPARVVKDIRELKEYAVLLGSPPA
jgi:acetyltransferase-like isoleucine patch superfamily enzyme